VYAVIEGLLQKFGWVGYSALKCEVISHWPPITLAWRPLGLMMSQSNMPRTIDKQPPNWWRQQTAAERSPCSMRYFTMRLCPSAAAWCSPVRPQRFADNRSTPLRWTCSSWNHHIQHAQLPSSNTDSDILVIRNRFSYGYCQLLSAALPQGGGGGGGGRLIRPTYCKCVCRSVCLSLRVSRSMCVVCVCVIISCEQNISKSYKRIMVNFLEKWGVAQAPID